MKWRSPQPRRSVVTQNMHMRHADMARTSETVVDRPAASAVVGKVLVLISAAVLLIVGAITLQRAGLNGDMAVPVVSVAGFTHTAWLGVAELAFGLLLL